MRDFRFRSLLKVTGAKLNPFLDLVVNLRIAAA